MVVNVPTEASIEEIPLIEFCIPSIVTELWPTVKIPVILALSEI